jgi:hypothetical protein
MSAQPDRHLRPVEDTAPLVVVNPETGERMGMLADYMQSLEDEVAGLQRDVRGWAARYGDLKRNKDAEAEKSEVWPAAVRVFEYWRVKTGRSKRTIFTLDRFELVRPWLEKLGDPKATPDDRLAEAEALCKLAVDGIAFDHYVEQAKNGTQRHHTGFHLIFKEADQFEKRCNSAPRERIAEVIGSRTVKQAMAGKKATAQPTLDQPQGEQ